MTGERESSLPPAEWEQEARVGTAVGQFPRPWISPGSLRSQTSLDEKGILLENTGLAYGT